jgi:hypothetical protein
MGIILKFVPGGMKDVSDANNGLPVAAIASPAAGQIPLSRGNKSAPRSLTAHGRFRNLTMMKSKRPRN